MPRVRRCVREITWAAMTSAVALWPTGSVRSNCTICEFWRWLTLVHLARRCRSTATRACVHLPHCATTGMRWRVDCTRTEAWSPSARSAACCCGAQASSMKAAVRRRPRHFASSMPLRLRRWPTLRSALADWHSRFCGGSRAAHHRPKPTRPTTITRPSQKRH